MRNSLASSDASERFKSYGIKRMTEVSKEALYFFLLVDEGDGLLHGLEELTHRGLPNLTDVVTAFHKLLAVLQLVRSASWRHPCAPVVGSLAQCSDSRRRMAT
jgi:hypothetical protein